MKDKPSTPEKEKRKKESRIIDIILCIFYYFLIN
jgi:hypothetical protein